MATKTSSTTARRTFGLRIVGAEAREIERTARQAVAPWCTAWTEVKVMHECEHGCKLYARRPGTVMVYALMHSKSYGCSLGINRATETVHVKVSPKATTR